MKSNSTEGICSICMDPEQKEMWRCAQCHVHVHKECAELFGQSQKSTPKKTKYENRVYGQIREFPQIKDPQYSESLNVYICESCSQDDPKKIFCHFCGLFDGSMAKIKFKNEKEKNSKRRHPDGEEEPKKWAHMNCILKLYNTRPHIDYDRSVVLESDALANAPLCDTCEQKYKLDVKCTKCGSFYAHNLCLNNEKTNVKLCGKCCKSETPTPTPKPKSEAASVVTEKVTKAETANTTTDNVKHTIFSERISTQATGSYIARVFKDILNSKKYQDFCDPKPDDNGNQGSDIEEEEGENEEDVQEDDEIEQEEEEPEEKTRIKNHFFSINEEGQLVYSFPFAQKSLFSDTATKSEEEEENTEMQEEPSLTITTATDSKNTPSEGVMAATGKHKQGIKEQFDKSLDELVASVKKLYYISSYQILKGLIQIYTHRCSDKDVLTKLKLTVKWYQLLTDLNRKDVNWLQAYDEKMKRIISDEFVNLAPFRVQTTNWPCIPKHYRKYVPLEGFVMSSEREGFKKEIERVITTKKQHKCSHECACSRLSQLGPYLHDKQTWDSACPGRALSMECDEHCGCDLSVCQNHSISGKKRKVLNKDIVETFCWGIDYATHRAITIVLPDFETIDKHDFIEKKLLKAVHHSETPWDMISVCKQIIKKVREGSKLYNNVDALVAKTLIRAIKFINTFTEAAFRLHTKGYGVVCKSETGMAPNALVAEYYGELYTPWRWFEKQDLIKKYCKEKKMINNTPDFYNIMLEKHKDDPDGYDIVVIDPIHKGNFASRFSHSCDPNCSTISTIADGKYGIAMYGLKPISFGEELTFDYYSVTENEKEYRQAICLCGSQNCRIRYLNLITSRNQNSYLDKNQSFLRRNYLIYRCHEPLTKEDSELMESYSIKSSILENCTNWLKKWISLVLQFVREEKNQFVDIMLPVKIAEHEAQTREKITPEGRENLIKLLEIEKLSLEADRIQNLTITVNKIRHVLDLIREKDKPKNPSRFKKTTRKAKDEDLSTQADENTPQPAPRMSTRSSRNTGPRRNFAEEFNEEEPKVTRRNSRRKGKNDEDDDEEVVLTKKRTTRRSKSKAEESFELEEPVVEEKRTNGEANGDQLSKEEIEEESKDQVPETMEQEHNEPEVHGEDDVPPPFIKIKPLDVANTLLDCNRLLRNASAMKSSQDVLRFFTDGEGILDKLLEMIHQHCERKNDLGPKIKTAILDTIDAIKMYPKDYEFRFYALRRLCLYLSNIFTRLTSNKHIDYQGIADTLYFYSITFTYFTNYNYPTVSSYDPVVVRACDVPNPAKYFSEKGPSIEEDAKILQEVTKSYSASYIWAQLTIWWKQTVEKPEATLSQERRGTVSNPTFEQSFLDTHQKDLPFDYPYGSRENWHRKLIEAPSVSWPIFKNPKRKSMTWSFKNDKRMYGTFLFEGVVQESKYETFVEDVVRVLNKSEEERNKLFCRLNTIYFKNIGYDFPCEMKVLSFKNTSSVSHPNSS